MNQLKELLHKINLFSYFEIRVLLLIVLIVFITAVISSTITFLKVKSDFSKEIKKAREDALKRSRAVIGGQTGEQIAPFLPNFPCNPADCKFIGKPIDFIAFSGASTQERINEIVFIEVKSGTSALTRRERDIKECIKDGKVKYVEYRIPDFES